MKRLQTLPLALTALLLAACGPSGRAAPSAGLPAPPADLRACLARAPADIPDRALSVGDVERGWKEDRRIQASVRGCGQRLAAWYEDLRKGWR